MCFLPAIPLRIVAIPACFCYMYIDQCGFRACSFVRARNGYMYECKITRVSEQGAL